MEKIGQIINEFNIEMKKCIDMLTKELNKNYEEVKTYTVDLSNYGEVKDVNMNNPQHQCNNKLLQYYWLEFKNNEDTYKISLFYKDFDNSTGNIHVLLGALQIWRLRDTFKEEQYPILPIYLERTKVSVSITPYIEFGWEPLLFKPYFVNDENVLLIAEFISRIINNELINDLIPKNITSNEYYIDFNNCKSKIITGNYRNGHYLRYSLLKWSQFENKDYYVAYQRIVNTKIGYFAKYGDKNTCQNMGNYSWKLDYPDCGSEEENNKIVKNELIFIEKTINQ